ncbi:MAG: hypothetical protein CM15mP58_23170 [Burkholderiaceae bacterium]|nr:MAG: hypothetical protein CM15mP58_23170 [Burkholderiaceae bacterium]
MKDDFIEIMNISLLEKAKSGSSGDKDSFVMRCLDVPDCYIARGLHG